MWIHIDIWFNKVDYKKDTMLNSEQQEDFEIRIASFLENIKHLIKRKFYLYEDIPHCFIALELKKKNSKIVIDTWRKVLFKAPYIYKSYINDKQTNDQNNGEGFLNILNAFTDFHLFHKDNKTSHIIHCCLEPMLQSRKREVDFYKYMQLLYENKKGSLWSKVWVWLKCAFFRNKFLSEG